MKKKVLIALLLMSTVFFGVKMTNVFAGNGPSDEFSFVTFYDPNAMDDSSNKSIYEPNTVHNDALEGATYDKATNTLTLNNLKTTLRLSVNEMGEDFKINLVGENEIPYIIIYGFGYGGNVEFTGDGSLTVNKEQASELGILMAAEGTVGKITVDETVTLKVYGSKNAFSVVYSTEADSSKVVVLKNGQDISSNINSELMINEVPQQMRVISLMDAGNSEYLVATKDGKKHTVSGEGPYTVSTQTVVTTGSYNLYDPWSNPTGTPDATYATLEELEQAGYTLTEEHITINAIPGNFGNFPLAQSENGTKYIYTNMYDPDMNVTHEVYDITNNKVTLSDGYEYTIVTLNTNVSKDSLTDLIEEVSEDLYIHEYALQALEISPSSVKQIVTADDNTSDNDKEAAQAVNELLAYAEAGKTITGMSEELIVIILEAVERGDSVSVELETNNIAADSVSSEISNKVKDAIKNEKTLQGANILGYFDVNLLVKVNDDTLDEKVTELNKEIEVKLDISSLLSKLDTVAAGKTRVFKVVRIHDGKVDVLDATLNDDNTLSFKTDRFSSYTVTYSDVVNPNTLDDTLKYGIILGVFGVALVVIVAFIVKTKKQ